jgi:predicted nucleic acid-binding protein
MLVVADTSPLRYLVVIQAIEILPLLYERVVVPQAVLAELQHPRSPREVRDWLATSNSNFGSQLVSSDDCSSRPRSIKSSK